MSKKDSDKDLFQKKILEKQQEAKIVRKIVLTIFIVLLIVFSGIIGGGYLYINSALKPVDPSNNKQITVSIPIGSSVSSIAKILKENGLIKDEKIFRYYVKFKNESGFQAGKYTFTKAMSFQDIINGLKDGKVTNQAIFQLTIPEGRQITEIAKIISNKTSYPEDEILKKLTDKKFIQSLQKEYPNILTDEIYGNNIKYALEGYLFPATYFYYEEKPTLEQIIDPMVEKTSKIVSKYYGELEPNNLTVHQFLTMASLIEEEATAKADREKISSVFYNRLDEEMPLQTDPTVLYALGKHKDRVLYKDLEVDSPYNTYRNKGLPPGPIANAGEMSLTAALQPEQTDFLYFLATKEGEVIFTKTLQEHNKEKAKHITNQDKAEKGS
ncbi:endolytic transglycosylase MltG [Metabacillus fastidiosus]|uniref:Endolytic murein transglycosylase n=1 Tax=Metabacillus fastidiosus TaxID=1458 RepID=A0ABU6NVG4_9BACI|nr:endolytic transglycosylase MltG [Metabacillus fastidiosus]MED4401026.1 endolytic transglycosylase MltG [Metabacillus fastidiosus]MED4453396.1 endolytic transglycosylase MltG [Metabacillus fastidiosus]MED4463952.1 endolytic transglycosylase MltG [Metabacillus fastidiosus]